VVSDPSSRQPAERAERLAHSSFPAFYQYWRPRLIRYLMTQTTDGRWVDDIAQDALLVARENWDRLLTYDKPGAWLFKVATTMLRRWQSKAREQCTSLDDMIARGSDPYVHGADMWVDEHLDLVAAIRSLPRRQREVIALHCLLEHSLAEVADILSITEGSAKTHLHRARKRLEELLRSPRAVTVIEVKGPA
jgi:RNA polymerase sigma factor (sigma-70 family)